MSLLAWYPLIKDTKNYGLDGTDLQVMGSVPFSEGKFGKSATFSFNTANCLYRPNFNLYKNFSLTFFMKCTAFHAGTPSYFISQGRDVGDVGFHIVMLGTNGDLLRVKYGHVTEEINNISNSITIGILETGVWYHVAVTYDESGVKCYLNGELVGTGGYIDLGFTQCSDSFTIGKLSYRYYNTSNYFPFDGQLNDVRIYDEVLSIKQIKELSKGLIVHMPLDEIAGAGDCSGYGWNSGFSQTQPILTASPDGLKYSKFYNFSDTVSNFAYCEDPKPRDAITVSVWANLHTNFTNTDRKIISSTESGGLQIKKDIISNNNEISASLGVGNDSFSKYLQLNFGTYDNWNMLTFTFDGYKLVTYVNGEKKSTGDSLSEKTKIFYGNYITHFIVGGGVNYNVANAEKVPGTLVGFDGSTFNGGISDLRIYATALSDNDVKELYETSASFDNKNNLFVSQFNETTSGITYKKSGIYIPSASEYYVTDDGAVFMLLCHHNLNGGANLFTTSNAMNNQEHDLYSRIILLNDSPDWFLNDGSFEFLVTEPEDFPGTVFRWKQTSNPYTTSAVTGFENISNMSANHALIKYSLKYSDNKTLLCAANDGWWSAIGQMVDYSNTRPGFYLDTQIYTYGPLNFYARVNTQKIKMFNNEILVNNIIEI